jgi:hypothetical protein
MVVFNSVYRCGTVVRRIGSAVTNSLYVLFLVTLNPCNTLLAFTVTYVSEETAIYTSLLWEYNASMASLFD